MVKKQKDLYSGAFKFPAMVDINMFSEPSEQLAREVRALSQYHDGSLVTFFAEHKGELNVSDPVSRQLDIVLRCLSGTYGMMSNVAAGGADRGGLEFNVLINAANGDYNPLGIVNGGCTPAKPVPQFTPDSLSLRDLTSRLQQLTAKIPETAEGRKAVFDALRQKLVFEAAIYDAMKKHYGISLAGLPYLPSLQDMSRV